ncbi:3-oxoadipate enol-lactonase [Celeribacter indicus]|uniref:3-oxoadipate enol-lactonase n=1 Tax=Celeribacter indicus TaxID=1208324 RepID=A0A0B5DXT7_9RHOB|nr:3-oxoadipate enol-lactonase [Celeribacter indicus]AJE45556.1 3-oxoadipate enol-lactonase [Celeribacter indicus]SDW86122.1 3-oxoadipate enol-lactonase [Celeribacter indicus]
MQALTCDWGTMHLRADGGAEEGTTLVFINSLGTDLRMWDEVVARLPEGWSSLRMDKRGHGLSETAPEGYGIPDLAGDVLAAMDHAGIGRAVIVGCSIGGLIAQHVALMAPERVAGLVLSNTAPMLGAAEGWHARIDGVRANGMAAMAEGILPRWFGPRMLARPEAALWRTLLARTDREGYIATCAAIAGTDITDRLGEIARPALVIGGKHDLATPPDVVEKLARALPRADLVMFGDTGHLPAIEAPADFTAALVTFVERINS